MRLCRTLEVARAGVRGKLIFCAPLCSLLLAGLVLFALTFAPRAAATGGSTFYVATNGGDSNPGTLAQPWLTLQHAADVLNAGDTVFAGVPILKESSSPAPVRREAR
jgi:hypothetical protein